MCVCVGEVGGGGVGVLFLSIACTQKWTELMSILVIFHLMTQIRLQAVLGKTIPLFRPLG